MKRIFSALALVAAVSALQAADPAVQFNKNGGRVNVVNIFEKQTNTAPFTISEYNKQWKPMKSYNFDFSEMRGRIVTADDERINMEYKYQQIKPNEAAVTLIATADAPVPTGRLLYSQMLLARDGFIPKVVVNGKDISFPLEYNAKLPYDVVIPAAAEGKENVAVVTFQKGEMTLRTKAAITLRDMRRWKAQCLELRLMFIDEPEDLIEAKLEFTVSVVPLPVAPAEPVATPAAEAAPATK